MKTSRHNTTRGTESLKLSPKFKRTPPSPATHSRRPFSKESLSTENEKSLDDYVADVVDDEDENSLADSSNKSATRHHCNGPTKHNNTASSIYPIAKKAHQHLAKPIVSSAVGLREASATVFNPPFQVKVLKPKIDRLAATIALPEPLHLKIISRCKVLVAEGNKDAWWIERTFVKGGAQYGYNYNVCFTDINGNRQVAGLLQLDPKLGGYAFLRIEMNPAKVGKAGCKAMKLALKYLIGKGCRAAMSKAKITYLDVAVDVVGVPIEAIIVFSNRTGNSSVWGRHFDRDRPERLFIKTFQIGSKVSRRSLTAYDKWDERQQKGIQCSDRRHVIRLEGHQRPFVLDGKKPRHGIYLNELHLLPNPFENINVAYYCPSAKGDWGFDLLLHAAQQVGMEAALAKVGRSKRAKYRAWLKEGAVDWWQPNEIMAGIPLALKKTGLFPPDAFGT